MGTDIHQLNIVKDGSGKVLSIEGIWPDMEYSKESKLGEKQLLGPFPELVECRNYALFAILAGERGEEFEIQDREHGIPKELEGNKEFEAAAEGLFDFTWYTLPQLLDGLRFTLKKIKLFIKASAFNDPAFVSLGEIDTYIYLQRDVRAMIQKLEDVWQFCRTSGKEELFENSVVLFAFDC